MCSRDGLQGTAKPEVVDPAMKWLMASARPERYKAGFEYELVPHNISNVFYHVPVQRLLQMSLRSLNTLDHSIHLTLRAQDTTLPDFFVNSDSRSSTYDRSTHAGKLTSNLLVVSSSLPSPEDLF